MHKYWNISPANFEIIQNILPQNFVGEHLKISLTTNFGKYTKTWPSKLYTNSALSSKKFEFSSSEEKKNEGGKRGNQLEMEKIFGLLRWRKGENIWRRKKSEEAMKNGEGKGGQNLEKEEIMMDWQTHSMKNSHFLALPIMKNILRYLALTILENIQKYLTYLENKQKYMAPLI